MANKKSTIRVQGTAIRIFQERQEDFISLTDIAKKFNPRTEQQAMAKLWATSHKRVVKIG